MSTPAAFAALLVVLVAVNVWVHVGPRRVHLVTGPLAALLLLLVGRRAGLSWAELGLGRGTFVPGLLVGAACIAVVGAGYAVGMSLPVTRGAFRDTRYRLGPAAALHVALVAVPLGTVLFEEVAFRGLLWGLVDDDHGAVAATAWSAVLFGLWHVLPALDLTRTSTAVRGAGGPGRRKVLLTVLATVAFTTAAGVLFGVLRAVTGSLLAPMGLHWATNGLGVLASARVWALSPPEPPPRPQAGG